VLATGLRLAIARTFEHGNRALCRDVGLDPAALDLESRAAPPDGERCFMDRVFSFETHVAIASLAALMPTPAPKALPDAAALPAAAQAILTAMAADWRRDDREP
jgi:hypothetical protein